MPRRITLAIIGSALLLTACDPPPKKPAVEMCFLDFPAQECICGLTTGEPGNGGGIVLAEQTRKPLEYCDKATMFRPAEWERVQNYIHEMAEWIKRRWGGETPGG